MAAVVGVTTREPRREDTEEEEPLSAASWENRRDEDSNDDDIVSGPSRELRRDSESWDEFDPRLALAGSTASEAAVVVVVADISVPFAAVVASKLFFRSAT